MIRPSLRACAFALLCAGVFSCSENSDRRPAFGLTVADHEKYFPIGPSAVHALGKQTEDGAIACETCHASEAVEQVTCLGCHKHPLPSPGDHDVNASLHLDAPDYPTRVPAGADLPTKSAGCLSCHKQGEALLAHFPHGGIEPGESSFCATCHDVGHPFAALPKPGFTHQDMGGADCGACHDTDDWEGASSVPRSAFDPRKSLSVDALIPRYSGTSIASLTPNSETLNMTMNHGAKSIGAGVLAVCSNCHEGAASGVYYPGLMHSSLVNLGVPQPTRCLDCHGQSSPTGFVGDTDSTRSPPSGGMKHDAVTWVNGAPTTTKLLNVDCSVCHQAPNDQVAASWKFEFGRLDAGALVHASLTAAGLPQPESCLDCHANSRPTGVVTSGSLTFDHRTAMGACGDCHKSTERWSGGQYHVTGSATPNTCLPCHETERPTSTTGWSGNYAATPFDYTGNPALGSTHGADQDCASCHKGPGTGQWGSTPNWQKGDFDHGPNSIAPNTCIGCHSTQRPDLLSPPADAGFDHASSGTGDCSGCHAATLTRGTFAALRPIPGGDWRGGQTYPGSALITAPNQFVRLPTTTLTRSGTTVTGMTTSTTQLPNAMRHTSNAIPRAVFPGSATAPDNTTCWHCHTNTNGTVTAYSNGKFHSALTNYRASPTGPIIGLLQPASGCGDCHTQMRPPNLVSKTDAGTWLLPMDHSATFAGGNVTGVPAMDCSSCHKAPGSGPTQWSDGRFHPALPTGASPTDCVSCHYPLMTAPSADVTSATKVFAMKHRSTGMTSQTCTTCHASALNRSTVTPVTTALWNPGTYHATVGAQPAGCLDCHGVSEPTQATQGTVKYTFMSGGSTPSNQAQWMNHTDSTVAGKDCATCHRGDARASGSAWNEATPYHAAVTTVTTCSKCHGTANGQGAVIGTNNNLPAGLTSSSTVTTSSVSPGLHDQLTHADLNVSAADCAVCHTQKGPSTTPGIQGQEWKVAKFHSNFGPTRPLVMNTTTARCSNCHLNVKPPGVAGGQDHAAFTGASGSQDCSSCHAYPGTGTSASPNWKGAAGFPTTISVGGFTIPIPPAKQAGTVQVGISNLPHPAVTGGTQCTACHPASTNGHRHAAGYNHASSLINSNCGSCHEAGSDLVSVSYGGTTHGDTRAVGNQNATHFYAVDCKECHLKPSTGNGVWTTGANAQKAWKFNHDTTKMTWRSTCKWCH